MEDRQIIGLFFARAESALEETERAYGRYCRTIAERIVGNTQDAEECVSDALLQAWNTIPPKQPASLKAYVGMLTRSRAIDRSEQLTAQKRGGGQTAAVLDELAECVPDGSGGDVVDRIALRDALSRFVAALPVRTRRIFVRRYWYASPIAELASDFGMKQSAVTMLLLRTREDLKQFLTKEGIDL